MTSGAVIDLEWDRCCKWECGNVSRGLRGLLAETKSVETGSSVISSRTYGVQAGEPLGHHRPLQTLV